MTMQLLARPVWLASITILALLMGPVAGATPPPPDENPTVCSGAPAPIGSVLAPEVATAEDVQAFRKAVNSLRVELDTICKRDKAAFKLFRSKAKKVVFEMGAGATEPTAYLKDGQLIVEFYGGPFDARSFRQTVKKVLQGKPVPHDD